LSRCNYCENEPRQNYYKIERRELATDDLCQSCQDGAYSYLFENYIKMPKEQEKT